MFLAGIQGRFRTGPPTKTFGGDDLGRIAKKYVEVKALLNKSSNQCPGVVLDGLVFKVARTKVVAYTRADFTKSNPDPEGPSAAEPQAKESKDPPLISPPSRGRAERGLSATDNVVSNCLF